MKSYLLFKPVVSVFCGLKRNEIISDDVFPCLSNSCTMIIA